MRAADLRPVRCGGKGDAIGREVAAQGRPPRWRDDGRELCAARKSGLLPLARRRREPPRVAREVWQVFEVLLLWLLGIELHLQPGRVPPSLRRPLVSVKRGVCGPRAENKPRGVRPASPLPLSHPGVCLHLRSAGDHAEGSKQPIGIGVPQSCSRTAVEPGTNVHRSFIGFVPPGRDG